MVILVPLHMLEVDGDAREGATDAADGMDQVSMHCTARGEFLGLLGLVQSALIVTSHNDGSSSNSME